MKGPVLHGQRDIRIEDLPSPKLEPGEVLIKVAWCGICGSDLHNYIHGPHLMPSSEKPHPLTGEGVPLPLGHEFSGYVQEISEDVEVKDLEVGEPVVVFPILHCDQCDACLSDPSQPNLCGKIGFVGISGRGGGLFPLISVKRKQVFKLPKEVGVELGACVEPLTVALHAVKKGEIQKDDSALVIGGGPIGCFIIKWLKAFGASPIICSEPLSSRRTLASKCGADILLDPLTTDIASETKRLTGGGGGGGAEVQRGTSGGGAKVVFDCAGVKNGFVAGFGAVEKRGKVINVALYADKVDFHPDLVTYREVNYTGSCAFDYNDFQETIDALASGKIVADGIVTSRIDAQDVVSQGLEKLADGSPQLKILVRPIPLEN